MVSQSILIDINMVSQSILIDINMVSLSLMVILSPPVRPPHIRSIVCLLVCRQGFCQTLLYDLHVLQIVMLKQITTKAINKDTNTLVQPHLHATYLS